MAASGVPAEFQRKGIDPLMRADVKELIALHRDAIDSIRSQVGPEVLAVSGDYDDIFLLRFVLTWGKKNELPKAVDAVKHTVQWRETNRAKLAECARPGGKIPHEEMLDKFVTAGEVGFLGGMEPIYAMRLGCTNFKGLMKTLPLDHVFEFLLFVKERTYKICDERTRKTGKLIKQVVVVDYSDSSMYDLENSFFKAAGESSKLAAIYYPQLLGKTVLINTPSYLPWIFRMLSPFFPKSFMEKISVCHAKDTHLGGQSASVCPFVKHFCQADLSTFPTHFGGTGEIPDCLKKRSEVLRSGLIHVHLANRSSTTVEIDSFIENAVAQWEICVENFGIGMSAVLNSDDGTPPIEVMPFTKIKAVNGLVCGSFLLPKTGKLVVTFDNSYSIFRHKDFEYSIKADVTHAMASLKEESAPGAAPARTVVHM